MAKLTPYETGRGAFAAINDFDATAKAQYITAGGSAENIAVPTGGTLVCLCATEDSWYEADATATIPTGDETSGSSILLPSGIRRFVTCRGVTNISVNSSTTGAIISALFWTD